MCLWFWAFVSCFCYTLAQHSWPSSSPAESCGSFVGSPAGLLRNLPTSSHNALALLAGAHYKGISSAVAQGHWYLECVGTVKYYTGNIKSESIRAFIMCVVQGQPGLKGALGRHDIRQKGQHWNLNLIELPSESFFFFSSNVWDIFVQFFSHQQRITYLNLFTPSPFFLKIIMHDTIVYTVHGTLVYTV